ncbi:hypothetical protein FS749_013962 [Ceratobasidium sp. UAMH 11750]|nr:hypothetical protein FS749_013962 [Ceratobasidium sp. UAMH 11750]
MSRAYFSPDGQPSAPDQYQQFAESTSQAASSHDSGPGSGGPEGYGLVYGDNTFSSTDGATFEERLRALMRQQGDELRSFAEREGRNVDEIRSQAVTMANTSPHEFLYSAAMQPLTPQETITKMDAALEHLHQALGYDGFLAIVTPVDADGDGGITAGTKIGLEFWKGLRGGGLAGLKSLKLRCKASREAIDLGHGRLPSNTGTPMGVSASRKSLDIKQELNSAMRNALREAAGDPLAEMRWTKPEQLEGYGVRIIGWPPEIALRNPSNNPVRDNKTLLSLLKSGQLRFVKKDSAEWEQADPSTLVRATSQAQTQVQPQPQHAPAQLVQPPQQAPLTRPPSSGFVHPHTHQPHSPHAQQPPLPPAPATQQPPAQQAPPMQHPQIAYVYQVPSGQGWIPLSGVSVYGTPFPAPPQMVVEGSAGDGGTVNVSQISTPDGSSTTGGGATPTSSSAKKRRSDVPAGVGANGGKKRRGAAVEAASG